MISLFICQKSYIVIILKERWLNDLLNCGRVCFTGPSWRSLHQQAMQIKQNLYIFSFTSCKIQLCESVQNLWKPSERERESDYLPHWLYSKMSSTQVGFFFLSLEKKKQETCFRSGGGGSLVRKVRWPCRCCRTDFILGSSHVGGDGAFLLLGAHLPLPAALGGAYRWHAHGGRSLILWRRRQRSGGGGGGNDKHSHSLRSRGGGWGWAAGWEGGVWCSALRGI